MDFLMGYIFTDHKILMEYILGHYDVKYVKNELSGQSKFLQYQYGEIIIQPDERTLVFAEAMWKYGNKIPEDEIMTFVKIGDFGKARDLLEDLVEKFGGCVKEKKRLLFKKDIDKFTANLILKEGKFYV